MHHTYTAETVYFREKHACIGKEIMVGFERNKDGFVSLSEFAAVHRLLCDCKGDGTFLEKMEVCV